MALRLSDVSYEYGEGTQFAQRALAGVDLSIESGTLTLVVGATGSGKSTLLRVASGLIAPQSGRVELDGVQLERVAAGRRGVGIVFQSPENQLFAETVLADVAFGPHNQGLGDDEAADVAHQALSAVGLDPVTFSARSPFALSGGEARRAALAGILALDPAYLLLDEPTAGLDAEGRSKVMQAVEELRSRTGIVVVSHDVEEFLAVADRVVVLAEGRVVHSSEAGDLIADPIHLTRAGLAIPEVLEVQLAARTAGLSIPVLTLDPIRAASNVAQAAGWS